MRKRGGSAHTRVHIACVAILRLAQHYHQRHTLNVDWSCTLPNHAYDTLVDRYFVRCPCNGGCNKETVLGRLQHAVENRGLNFLKMVRGVDAKANYTSETASTSRTGYDHEKVKKEMSAIDFVDFSASKDILAVRQNIQTVLIKARKTMRKGFVKLEKEVMSKLSTVLDQVCDDDEGKECWLATRHNASF